MRAPARQGGEAGLTLIELLVTITIMGIVFAVFVGGIGLAIRASDQHKRVVTADTVLRNAAEELQRLPYQPCTIAVSHTPAYVLSTAGVPGDVTLEPPAFKGYLDQASDAQFVDPAATPCNTEDGGAQLLELRVSASASSGRPVRDQTLQVVKRR